MATGKGSGTASPKLHWAQTPEGKKKLAEAQRKSWRARRFAARRTVAPHATDGNLVEMVREYESLRKRIVERLGKAA